MRAAPLTTRRPLGCARVKPAQDDGAKTDPPAVVAEFLHTDQLARETLTDEHRVPAPLDLAIVAHPPDDLGGGVGQLGQPLRIRPRRGLVDGGGRPLPQRLVRALVVEDVAKLVEAALLGPPRRLRGCAVSCSRVRCIPSCRAFSSGCPGRMRSGWMPSLIHHTASRDSPAAAVEANGGPLSVRTAPGKPYSRNAASNSGRTWPSSGAATT